LNQGRPSCGWKPTIADHGKDNGVLAPQDRPARARRGHGLVHGFDDIAADRQLAQRVFKTRLQRSAARSRKPCLM
jgi:hypothetical protein